jgi:hypothetical protein
MKLRRRIGWLGWAVAAVLAVSAAGAAFAAGTGAPAASQQSTPGAVHGPLKRTLGFWRRIEHRVLHGEFTVHTKDGNKQVVVARGVVTAISDSSLTIKSDDGVSTTFTLTAGTKYGTRRRPATRADIKVGDHAGAVAVKAGDANQALRVIDLPLPPTGGKGNG